jgi:hypothetical protein
MALDQPAMQDTVTVKQGRGIRNNKTAITMHSESRDCVEVLYLLCPCYMYTFLYSAERTSMCKYNLRGGYRFHADSELCK